MLAEGTNKPGETEPRGGALGSEWMAIGAGLFSPFLSNSFFHAGKLPHFVKSNTFHSVNLICLVLTFSLFEIQGGLVGGNMRARAARRCGWQDGGGWRR